MTHRISLTRVQAARITALSAAAGMGLTLAAVAAPAWAHDSLISSSPEAGEVLETSPEEVVLEFSGDGLTDGESIANVLQISDAEGENWEGETEIEGATMSTELPEELPGGEYTVAYRAVYSDGHAEEQSFDFEVAAETTDSETPSESAAAESSENDDDAASSPSEEATEDATTGDPETQESDDQNSEDPGAAVSEEVVGFNLNVPTWVLAAGSVVVLGLLAAVVVAVLRGRSRRRD
ncbi:copper resistance CopC family protein [Nesterenkonia sp. Act20]|uniref:copper resistance CopC family protein n=1 Tax=Nesterenkonia sp. Act20 TaxID=1483432 RepID=UPI001C493A8F|nr:copper resistance CopC family protein [Nesterenkonia sp. Act20]